MVFRKAKTKRRHLTTVIERLKDDVKTDQISSSCPQEHGPQIDYQNEEVRKNESRACASSSSGCYLTLVFVFVFVFVFVSGHG